ncbi:MAG: maltose alpha-D-glucosyltransferase, partial [Planctomycetota bacterium]
MTRAVHPSPRTTAAVSPATDDPQWYKNAIIYELHVRAFHDSDGDGIGDFRGLTQKLDYLQDLGVTAIWLLPFYPSPLRDDGYDIADYAGVHPSYGTMRDVRQFIRAAHRRGLRVITELVINHTSDQHAWFQRARHAPPGSKHRDFYVWSDSPDRYAGTRIIFKDFESSNWTWDPVAKAYYWHRFYSHQPDLNFENPTVQQEIFKVMEFWFEAGVDGMRLDAVPYLYEREGTSCENLPETHEFLKKLRAHVDARFPGRMFLAEANQWPEDAVAYFGEGDECHMNFHFPLMPRLFMSLRMEDRFPIVDILQQTPRIPGSCQWALFLRNHDELTLEMVTDEERDYMYRVYAGDRRARINLGIRRRLAPLLENNRQKIELLNALLLSMPGTPVIYYGDEIGMGDNIYLGDRDGVRTPMQWSCDRNAGFSQTNPQRLYLPVIIDPEHHYEAINVEAQQNNATSLLWWMKRIIALRQRYGVFGTGDIEFLTPENHKVLAFVRSDEQHTVLVVANLSRFAQAVELDLSRFRGRTPVEMFGQNRFPPIGDLPYFVTLGPHGVYWFSLEDEPTATRAREVEPDRPEQREPPTIEVAHDLHAWVGSTAGRARLERVLARDVPSRRWYRSKSRTVRSTRVADVVPVPVETSVGTMSARFFLLEFEFVEGEPELYAVPLALASPEHTAFVFGSDSRSHVANLHRSGTDERAVLYDAMVDPDFCRAMLDLTTRRRRLRGERGRIVGEATRHGRELAMAEERLEVHPARVEQSNSSVVYADRLILKLFRAITPGINPDLEIS